MTLLTRIGLQPCDSGRCPAGGRDLPEPAGLTSEHDLVRAAPTGTEDEIDVAERDDRSAGQRDLLQRTVGVKTERLTIRREERVGGALGSCDGRSVQLIEAAQIELDVALTLGAEDERAAIGRKRHRRSARPAAAPRLVQLESAQQTLCGLDSNQHARD